MRGALLRWPRREADDFALPGRDGDGPEPPRPRRWVLIALGPAALAALAVVLVTLTGAGERKGRRPPRGGARAVAVTRQTLVQREIVDGRLGYGVELAGSRRIVPVRAGLFADGYVEIEGAGIREGTRVVVPDA